MFRRRARIIDRIVLARRSDGLGARLNAMLNGMRLADILGVPFKFSWPLDVPVAHDTTHAVIPADDFFSADFLDAHRLPDDESEAGFVPLEGRRNDLTSLRTQIQAAERGLVAPNSRLVPRIDPQAVPEVSRGFSAEFARIGFHPEIGEAITAANDVHLSDGAVGIHLRAGDHIFGRFRLVNRFWDKTIPAPIARELIMRARSAGEDVLVFGQDEDLLTELCTSTGATDARALRPPSLANRSAEAMFDLVVMSRCHRIMAGDSGFAVQAAAIGDRHVELHVDLISPEESLAITRADLEQNGDRYHPKQRAFAWWAAYYRVRHDISRADAADLIGAALEADPDNPRSRLRLAALSYRAGDVAGGDEVLVDALIDDAGSGRGLRSVLIFARMRGSRFDSREIIGDFEHGADAGAGPALVYRAAIRAQRGDAEGAAEDVAAFRAYVAMDQRLCVLPELDKLVTSAVRKRPGRRAG